MGQARSSRVRWWLSRALGRLAPAQLGGRVKNPTFFIGCGRSGTTWLGGVLASHPEIAIFPTEANDLWHPRAYPWHTAEIETPPFWYDARTFTRLSLAARRPGDDVRLKGLFGAYQFLDGGEVFLNKSVMITFMIPYILRLFPEARFVHLVRDGRAVAFSYARKEGKKIEANGEYGRKGYHLPLAELLERFAAHWQEHVEEIERQKMALGLVENGRLLEFSYEALCANPEQTLNDICSFLGVRVDGAAMGWASGVKNMNYKYREQLEPTMIKALTDLIGPTLDRYGYRA